MITVKQFRDWLKSNVDYGEWCGMGRMDKTKSKAICVYPNRGSEQANFIVGGEPATGYYVRTFQLLIRWGTDLDVAETKALELYSLLSNTVSNVLGHKILIIPQQKEPVFLGSDDKGVYEYTLLVTVYYEK
jgi:hypothetical protein